MCIYSHTSTHIHTPTNTQMHIYLMQCSINSLTLSFQCGKFMISILENMNHKNTNTHALKTHISICIWKTKQEKIYIYYICLYLNWMLFLLMSCPGPKKGNLVRCWLGVYVYYSKEEAKSIGFFWLILGKCLEKEEREMYWFDFLR